MSDKSTFLITDPETGKDIQLTLAGYAKLDKKVFAVCTKPTAEASGNSAKTVIFRILYDKLGQVRFGLVDDADYCQKVMDAFIECKIEEKEKMLNT